VSDRISCDDATEIVGRAKFGDAWVGPATDEEFKLAKKYRSRFKTGAKVPEDEAPAIEWAEEREARADRQRREVNHWLENRGFNTVRSLTEGFDRSAFHKAFEAEFGPAARRRGGAAKGPVRGEIDRFGDADRALFPEIERLMKSQRRSVTEAVRILADEHKLAGRGSLDSRIRRLSDRFRKEKSYLQLSATNFLVHAHNVI
jgi:hypothetical protein